MKRDIFARALMALVLALQIGPVFGQQDRDDDDDDSPSQPQEQPKERYLFGALELPANTYDSEDFFRIVDGKKISLAGRIVTSGVILHSAFLSDADLIKLEEEYGLKQERQLDGFLRLFSFTEEQKDMTLGELIQFINVQHIMNVPGRIDIQNVNRALPIFLFEDGLKYLTGNIVIAWGPNVGEAVMDATIGLLKVYKKSFDPKTRVMIVEPTDASGYNIFKLADAFSPQKGNSYVLSVEPQYAPLEVPLTLEAKIEPADGVGHGGDIIGSAFRYTLEIRTKHYATLSLDELRVASDPLKGWYPQKAEGNSQNVSPMVFDVEGAEHIAQKQDADGTLTTVIYRFRISQAGEFTLRSPEVHYHYFDTQLKQEVAKTTQSLPVKFWSAGTMPPDATMVNDVTTVLDLRPQNPLPRADELTGLWVGLISLAVVFGAMLLTTLGISSLSGADVQTLPAKERARDRWKQAKPELRQVLTSTDPKNFWGLLAQNARSTLGILVAGDEKAYEAMEAQEIAEACSTNLGEDVRNQIREFFEVVFRAHFDPGHQAPIQSEAEELIRELESILELVMKEETHVRT